MKTLSVGIGCRQNCSAAQIEAAVRAALGTCDNDGDTLGLADIATIATVDLKADEPGLREFCARHALPLETFSREQIAALPRAATAPSAAAREHLGVDGVCEPCALLAASKLGTPDARLIVRKTILDGVTVAVAIASPVRTGFESIHTPTQDRP